MVNLSGTDIAILWVILTGAGIIYRFGKWQGTVDEWKKSIDSRYEEINQWKNDTDKWKNGTINTMKDLQNGLKYATIITNTIADPKNQMYVASPKIKKVKELANLIIPTENPISTEEIERFDHYIEKVSLGEAFTGDEYRDFEFLSEKIGTELPKDKKEEWDSQISDLSPFVLGLTIEKRSIKKVEPEEIEIKEISIGEQIYDNLSNPFDAKYYKLKEVKIGKLIVKLEGPIHADFDLYVKYGSNPTLTDFDYRSYTAEAIEEVKIMPLQPGDYYIMVHSYRGSGDYRLATIST